MSYCGQTKTTMWLLNSFILCFQLSWADIQMFQFLAGMIDPTDPLCLVYLENALPAEWRTALLKDFPLLDGLVKRVGEVPAIKTWMEARPANDKEPF